MHDNQIEPLLRALAKTVTFHGLCAIDWIQEAGTGRIFVIEFNPRPTPSLYAGTYSGVSFSRAIAGLLHGGAVPERPAVDAAGEFVMFPESMYHAIDSQNLGLIARSVASAPFHDPGLLFANVRRILTHYARKSVFFRRPAPHRAGGVPRNRT